MTEKNAPRPSGGTHLVYGSTIHTAVAKGNLQEMKDLAARAEQHIKDYGDVAAALEVLKAEIAKAEKK